MMKFCGKCGESVANSKSKFCSNCYQRIEPNIPSTPVTQVPSVAQVPPVAQEVTDEHMELKEHVDINATQEDSLSGEEIPPKKEPLDKVTYEQPCVMEIPPRREPLFNTYESNETEDISKAFYTSDTGVVLPINRLEAPEERRPKKGFLLPLLLGVGVVAIVATAIGLVVSGMFMSPVDRFIAIQRDHIINPYIAAIEEAEDVAFSTDFIITANAQASGNDLGTMAMLSMLEQATLEVNFDISPDMAESLMGVNLHFLGEDVFSTVITIDEDYFGFYFPTLDENYYIISLETLEGDGGLNLGLFVPDFTTEELIDLVEAYSGILLSIVHEDNLEVNRESVSLFNGREELNAHVYTLTPTKEDFVQLLYALVQEFREDQFMYQVFAAQMDSWMLMFMGYENTAEAWQGILDEMEDEIDNLASTMAESGIIWRVATYRRQMILQEFYIPGGGFFRYEGFLARGGHRTDWFTLHVEDEGLLLTVENNMTVSGQNADGDLTLDFSQNSGRPSDFHVSATIDYNIHIGTSSILDIPYGVYELELRGDNNSFTGSLIVEEGANGGSDHILSLYDIAALQLSRLTLNIHTTDQPSTIQAPTVEPIDLSDMSPIELMMTLGGLISELEELFGLFNQL